MAERRAVQQALAQLTRRQAPSAVVICVGISLWAINSMISVTVLPSTWKKSAALPC